MSTLQQDKNRRRLFGIPIHAVTMDDTIDRADRAIAAKQTLQIGVVNAAKIVNMRRNPELNQAVLTSDLILADGMSVVWASKLLGRPLPERVAGIDLMMRLLELADRRKYRVYCLGATEAVIGRVAEIITRDYPDLQLVGTHHGYFSGEQEQQIVDEIAAAGPDILFVAMTSPKKEQFMARWSHQLHVPICHGVGGSFDVMAGKVQRAPLRWQKLGLEWLYRVLQEPRRMWKRYLVTNILFAGMLLRETFTRRT
jgi:N-acetylglucosaminyldiphosphoundecaprenol N-acetyl-beta-D-mannosaminyltransferase